MKRYDAVLRGAYGTGNFGDDVLLYSLLRYLYQHDLKKIAIISKKSDYIRKMLPGADVTVIHPSEGGDVFTKYYIWGGGTQFFSFPGWLYLRKKITDVVRHPLRFLMGKFARRTEKVRVNADIYLMVGIGFGPFRSIRSEAKVMRLAELCDYVFVRDKQSQEYVSRWLKEERFGLYADICYMSWPLIAPCRQKMRADVCSGVSCKGSTPIRVAIIVRDWHYTSAGKIHVRKTMDLAHRIKAEDNVVVDFVFLASDTSSRKMVSAEGFTCIGWDAEHDEINSFLDILDGYDYVITSRFHGVIFSVLLQKPCLIVAVEEKLDIAYQENKSSCTYWPRPYEIDEGISAFRKLQNLSPDAIREHKNLQLELGKAMKERLDEFF